tara:strand:+ start:51932 stop:52480 length:549 start_codon:yes stop_codon:yes gene_type:complete
MVCFILSKEIKIFIALIIVCTIGYLMYNKNWYQALIVMNISIHYKSFIEFFMDLDDEIIIKNSDDNKFTYIPGKKKVKEDFSSESNIKINKSYNNYMNNKSHTNEENNPTQYISHSINNIKDTIIDNHGANIYDMGYFSEQSYLRNKKINNRANNLYPNDDIKLMSHVELGLDTPWWEVSSV